MTSNTRTKQANLMDSIDSILRSLDKTAEAKTEPGSKGGPTSHPSKNVDDRMETASEGFRSTENTKDIKEQEKAPSVDSAPAGGGPSQEGVQLNIGLKSTETGDDPSVETESAKGGKDDGSIGGATSHPARTDNKELDGSKYAQFQELIKQAKTIGDALISEIAVDASKATFKKAGEMPEAFKKEDEKKEDEKKDEGKDEKKEDEKAKEAGYNLAKSLDKTSDTSFDKVAQDRAILTLLGDTVYQAETLAEKVAETVNTFMETSRKAKRAEDMTPSQHPAPPDDSSNGGDDKDSGGDMDPSATGGDPGASAGGGGSPSSKDIALLQLLLSGKGMGAEGAAAGMGAPAPGGPSPDMGGGAMGGGMPPGLGGMAGPGAGGPGAGGMPPGGGGGMPPGAGGAGGGGDEMAMLEQALQDSGVSADQVLQAAHAKQSSVTTTLWEPKTAADKAKYANIRAVIDEILSRKV